MIIYKTTNLINGKFYVGKDRKNRAAYLGSGIYLRKAIKKYGVANFTKEVLEHCETNERLNERERYYIKQLNTLVPNGYNLALGGDGGNTRFNPEVNERAKQKIRDAATKMTKEERSKKWGVRRGFHILHTEASKLKISIANYGEKNGMYGAVPWNKGGNCYSDEQLKRFSESHLGHKPWNTGRKGTKGCPKGSVWIYNAELNKYRRVSPELVVGYVTSGWLEKSPKLKERIINPTIRCACGCERNIVNPRTYWSKTHILVNQRFITSHNIHPQPVIPLLEVPI